VLKLRRGLKAKTKIRMIDAGQKSEEAKKNMLEKVKKILGDKA